MTQNYGYLLQLETLGARLLAGEARSIFGCLNSAQRLPAQIQFVIERYKAIYSISIYALVSRGLIATLKPILYNLAFYLEFLNQGSLAPEAFSYSGLSAEDLANIWGLVDIHDRGALNRVEFRLAMGLIYRRIHGIPCLHHVHLHTSGPITSSTKTSIIATSPSPKITSTLTTFRLSNTACSATGNLDGDLDALENRVDELLNKLDQFSLEQSPKDEDTGRDEGRRLLKERLVILLTEELSNMKERMKSQESTNTNAQLSRQILPRTPKPPPTPPPISPPGTLPPPPPWIHLRAIEAGKQLRSTKTMVNSGSFSLGKVLEDESRNGVPSTPSLLGRGSGSSVPVADIRAGRELQPAVMVVKGGVCPLGRVSQDGDVAGHTRADSDLNVTLDIQPRVSLSYPPVPTAETAASTPNVLDDDSDSEYVIV
ncbi:hypothetical protein CPB84DRAFT_1829447 [Gymnopilus junonius]|uniref:EH domain-containing protein n=1 Tax=Gymnopilus junonius TaxID=109634 RepID=A0A9P5TH26_GYMJU|nr:hypothetical protein CPB84DRAFT_1829447 [Gymnopilus junonius]